MFTLEEALKIAGLPPRLNEEASPDAIFKAAKAGAKSPDEEISADEEEVIKQDIQRKLDKGWTASEIRSFLSWMEYFNVEDDEDKCLRKMSEIENKVKARLGK